MMQEILVGIIFLTALIYLIRRVYKSVQARSCAGACKGCSSIDFSKIDTSAWEEKHK